MTQYVADYYSSTVLCTNDIELVKSRVDELLKKSVDKDKKFIDPDFGPTKKDPKGESAIFYPSDEDVEVQGDSSVGQYNNVAGLNIDMISWQRPRDFCKDPKKCSFVTDEASDDESSEAKSKPKSSKAKEAPKKKGGGASSLDVMQGNLGDCWFISAMSLVAIRDDLFSNIICNGLFKSYESRGIYVFKMHKNCRAHYVIIDDKVPCLEKARGDYLPAFARNRNPNEFWVSLFEKAYAKLNIRYINLTSGFIDEALQDLTGLAPEMIRFTPSVEPEDFWNSLKMLVYTNSLIGTSLNFLGRRDYPEDEKKELQREAKMVGIQYGHAYGILDVREVEVDGVVNKLLRIKNPWGKENNMEWSGEWGDADPRWTPEMKAKYNAAGAQIPSKLDKDELEHKFGKNDNIFIIGIEDYIRYFNTLMAVRDFPDEWSGIRYYSSWSPSYGLPPKSPNWAKNPTFPFSLRKGAELSVRLQQPDPRCYADARPPMKKLVLMLLIFKNPDQALTHFAAGNIALQSPAADSRSVFAELSLPAGEYLITVFTAADGVASNFYLSVYFNCRKEEIEFADKNWEVILEEEEEEKKNAEGRPRAVRHKGPVSIRTVDRKAGEEKKQVEEIEVEIHEDKDELEHVIRDPSILEVETEIKMSAMLGVGYNEYKEFHGHSKEKQEQIAENYHVVRGVVDLNDYGLGVRGVSTLAGLITGYKELEAIRLRNNQLSDQVVIDICRKLARRKTLREIDISENRELTDRAGAALLYLLGKLPSLTKIDISGTSISLDLAHLLLSRVNNRD